MNGGKDLCLLVGVCCSIAISLLLDEYPKPILKWVWAWMVKINKNSLGMNETAKKSTITFER